MNFKLQNFIAFAKGDLGCYIPDNPYTSFLEGDGRIWTNMEEVKNFPFDWIQTIKYCLNPHPFHTGTILKSCLGMLERS